MTDEPMIASWSLTRKQPHRVGLCFLAALLTEAFVSPPQLSKPGKLSDTFLPTVQNTVNVADLCWDPFNPRRLAVGEQALLTAGRPIIIPPRDSAVA